MQIESESALLNHIQIQYIVLINRFLTHTVTACQPDINITPFKLEDGGWLFIDVVNKNYVPVIDLKS